MNEGFDLLWLWTEHGMPMVMLFVISAIVGFGFRTGWIACGKLFKQNDKSVVFNYNAKQPHPFE